MSLEEHWENAYLRNPPEKLGWYAPHLTTSLNWIRECCPSPDAKIIDVGSGAATLVDDLLVAAYNSITAVELSSKALEVARTRLGEQAARVNWINGDITALPLPALHYDLWHDRAVFHFLTEPDQREKYREQLLHALKRRGHLILATFALEAPPRCSGLPVEHYTPDKLREIFGDDLELRHHTKELHVTPGGTEQMYLYCHFQRRA